jgi:hypothetical protein
MSEEKRYEIKEPKENLHWISFNTKKGTDLLREISEKLSKILERMEMKLGHEFNRSPSRNQDLPF